MIWENGAENRCPSLDDEKWPVLSKLQELDGPLAGGGEIGGLRGRFSVLKYDPAIEYTLNR